MAKSNPNYKTIKTLEGTVYHLYEHQPGRWTPHSYTGPSVIYPKGINKPDEYHIYGIQHNYADWSEISRPARKVKNREDLTD